MRQVPRIRKQSTRCRSTDVLRTSGLICYLTARLAVCVCRVGRGEGIVVRCIRVEDGKEWNIPGYKPNECLSFLEKREAIPSV